LRFFRNIFFLLLLSENNFTKFRESSPEYTRSIPGAYPEHTRSIKYQAAANREKECKYLSGTIQLCTYVLILSSFGKLYAQIGPPGYALCDKEQEFTEPTHTALGNDGGYKYLFHQIGPFKIDQLS
jgi:hypothetical protein